MMTHPAAEVSLPSSLLLVSPSPAEKRSRTTRTHRERSLVDSLGVALELGNRVLHARVLKNHAGNRVPHRGSDLVSLVEESHTMARKYISAMTRCPRETLPIRILGELTADER